MASKLETLLEWAKNNGSHIDEKITFVEVESKGYSSILNDDIADKHGLITVPRDLLITPDLAINFFGKEFESSSPTNNEQLQLFVAKLQFDKHSTKIDGKDISLKFKPYIDFLPSNGKQLNIPFYWKSVEKDLLKGTDAGITLNRKFNAIVEEWKFSVSQLEPRTTEIVNDLKFYDEYQNNVYDRDEKLYKLLNSDITSWTSFPAYLWSSCIFTSRAFPYLLVAKKKTNQGFLLPIVDLLNHENGRKVGWRFENDQFVFNSEDNSANLEKGSELFNNYGDKSNMDLLLGYGFVLDNNDYDSTTVTIKLDQDAIAGAKEFDSLPEGASAEGINFEITKTNPLPDIMVKLFAFLVQLRSEKGLHTLRMKLEGLAQIRSILESKVAFFKNSKVETNKGISINIPKIIKSYKNSQKALFQRSIDEVNRLEKALLKDHSPLSFKTVLKNDKTFANSLLLAFGTCTYDELLNKGLLDQCLLLWIIRNHNRNHYNVVDPSIFSDFIYNQFDDVKNTIQITKEDVLEYRDLYTALFPKLGQKIPEVYNKGEWTAKNFIIAGTVVDRIGYTRVASKELFLLEKVQV